MHSPGRDRRGRNNLPIATLQQAAREARKRKRDNALSQIVCTLQRYKLSARDLKHVQDDLEPGEMSIVAEHCMVVMKQLQLEKAAPHGYGDIVNVFF